MAINTSTVQLLTTTLASDLRRKLFSAVVQSRIAGEGKLKEISPNDDIGSDLEALKSADLIGVGGESQYYVTATGLKVARDLKELSIG